MKVKCLPVYIVVDTSLPMAPFEEALNEAIETLYDDLATSPRIAEFAQISILSYNDDAEPVLRMTDPYTLDALPVFKCGGASNFSKALILLRRLIDEDIPRLNSSGRSVMRPLVFLLMGSIPTNACGSSDDSWKREHASLVDQLYRRRPNIVPFGYGEAAAGILSEISTIPGVAFLATAQSDISGAFRQVLPALLSSVVASVEDNMLRLPTRVEGFISASPDFIEVAQDIVDDPPFISESTPEPATSALTKNAAAIPTRDQVFISYSHADRRWLQELQTHLRPYLRSAMIAVWDDSQIRAGAAWKESIENALASAKVAVLMVTPAFLASSFIAESELPPLLEAARNEGVTILWVPVRFSSFDITPIAAYQATHSPEKPLASLSSAARDKALVKICELIQHAYLH
jgi:uncharacterized protein YegL